ncbi:hypothetical protein [Nostocoides sp. HKS02]|uniref:hypothetical protein n=1 Tax=Nostocoides sp. HKS02 TaxID=1813880 RepID=UPI0012B455DC|nr:hypothetical protein [Tetrasphaera sp. HKS02]QGN58397.1 hypothetical protein GKE56_11450 [Tetrasphaera sp. HKS02]
MIPTALVVGMPAARRRGRPRASIAAVLAAVGAVGLASAPAAWASFASVATGSLSASTLGLAAPGTVSAAFTCPTGSVKFGSANVASFTAVPRATSYALTLTTPNGSATQTVPTPQQVTLSVAGFPNKGLYTLTIVAHVATWTGPAYTQTTTC